MPLRVRGIVSGIAPLVNLGISAVVVFSYPGYAEAVHLWFAWWTFTVIIGIRMVFVVIFVKETE